MGHSTSPSPRIVRISSAEVSAEDDPCLWQSRCWLEHAVIGLNLCPFANAVHSSRRLWFVLSMATDPEQLLTDLDAELQKLQEADAQTVESVLIIHPKALLDFSEYNDFLGIADHLVTAQDLDGVVQIASFHPNYQFAGVDPADVSNNTNRSPFPMLHLLRETSVSRAVDTHPDTHGISQTNHQVLTEMGGAGWAELSQRWDKL
jgi:hypothetical protein